MIEKMKTLKVIKNAYRETRRPLWRAVYKVGEKNGSKHVVNISKLNRLVPENAYVIVLGKVLGGGSLTKKIHVGAFSYSKAGKEKINKAGGEALLIDQFVEKYKDQGGIIIVK
ncbi:MAG: 50S ribosomal protein L18e [Nitrososphaeria archaeon]|jgi:Ribosomal protein L18E